MDNEETLPLYHIDGTENLADMITKSRKLVASDLSATSPWMSGLEWMTLPTERLPRFQFLLPEDPMNEQLVSVEVFPDVENYLLEVHARELLTALGPDALSDCWETPNRSNHSSSTHPQIPRELSRLTTLSHPKRCLLHPWKARARTTSPRLFLLVVLGGEGGWPGWRNILIFCILDGHVL